jgi:hypothetical protein
MVLHRLSSLVFVGLLQFAATQWDAHATVAKHLNTQEQHVVDELRGAVHEPWGLPVITVCGLYYDDPDYFKEQLSSWRNYSAAQRDQLEFVIIDDGSPNKPAIDSIDEAAKKELNIRLYR